MNSNLDVDEVKVITICYGKKRKWKSSKEALDFFNSCLISAGGSERSRYEKIIYELAQGKTTCTDEM